MTEREGQHGRIGSVPSPAGVIVVLRTRQATHVLTVVEALADCGLANFEVSLTTPGAMSLIAQLRSSVPHLAIGAGTVMNADQAEEAIAQGATYLLAPTLAPAMVHTALASGVAAIPGAATPTEVVSAWGSGASAVKVFPIEPLGGIRYMRALRQPLPDIPLVPTGDIALDDVSDYLRYGSRAVGIGGTLLQDALQTGETTRLRDRATRLVEQVAVVELA